MKYTSNERGAVMLLVIVLALVVAAAGIAAYNLSRARNKDAQTAASSPAASASPPASSRPTPTGNVFVVKELGIQLTVTDDIKDLVYVIRSSNGVSSADFSTASLVAADKNAGGRYCTPEADAPLGGISLVASASHGVIKTIGSRSLVYATPQSACSTNSSVMTLAIKQRTAFEQALKTAEAVH